MDLWDVARPVLVLGGFLAVAGSMQWAFYRGDTEGDGLWTRNARNQMRVARVIAPLGVGILGIGLLIAITSWIW